MRHAQLALFTLLLASGLTPLLASEPTPGPYTDELSKCLVKATTAEDKTLLVEWMFTTASLHPAVQVVASVSDSTREGVNRAMAELLQRLLTVSCRSEARLAVKYEGQSSIEASFGVLGQVAAREMFSHPQVSAGVSAFTQYLDSNALKQVFQSEP